ncbi:hypothetical protein D3C81_2287000 [compost metagenome]
MREQIEVLEHHADFGTYAFDIAQIIIQFSAVHHDAPLLVLFQAVKATNGR